MVINSDCAVALVDDIIAGEACGEITGGRYRTNSRGICRRSSRARRLAATSSSDCDCRAVSARLGRRLRRRVRADLFVVRKEELEDSVSELLREDVDQFARAQRWMASSTAVVIAPIGPAKPEEEEDELEEEDEDELDWIEGAGEGEPERGAGPR